MGIEGYILYRRDREDRKGGGVAIYCKSHLHSAVFQPNTIFAREMEVGLIKIILFGGEIWERFFRGRIFRGELSVSSYKHVHPNDPTSNVTAII